MEVFYSNGKGVIFETSLENCNKDRLTWIRIVGQDFEELETVSAFSGIPIEEFNEFFAEEEERSRIIHRKYLELIYQTPFTEEGKITTVPVNIFMIDNLFITLSRKKLKPMEKYSSLMKRKKLKFMFKQSIGSFLYNFIDKINDDFLHTIDKIADLADVLESRVGNVSSGQLSKLYNYNVTLTHFNQAIMANMEVLVGLKKSYFKKFTKEDLELFFDLYYDKLHIQDTEKIQREVISNLFNFQTIVATHKLNTFMKKLTVLALVIMVPTFITGLFGMNIDIPFANNPDAFLLS